MKPNFESFIFIHKSPFFDPNLPILLEFFATWCPPCHDCIPFISQLAVEQQGKINVISASTENIDKMSNFVTKFPSMKNQSVAVDGDKSLMLFLKQKETAGIPVVFLFNQQQELIWEGHPRDPALNKAMMVINGEFIVQKNQVPTDINIINGEYRQGIPCLIEIFQTSCPPCQAALQSLSELTLRYNEIQFIALTSERQDRVQKFFDKRPFLHNLTVAIESSGIVPSLLQHCGGAIPRGFLYDMEGDLIWEGFMGKELYQKIHEQAVFMRD
ncbi:putative FixW protein [Spironucleus salmonicida]|uniref:FixW protein n=1 Tax=Spironucleus salmonicida TaxID=348837 RepID=V6LY18_9EUKA|nr:putative FixW protein [Spironucleus salmonicida]|eukprot:EST45674.1 Redoxin domain protein [Spironucleus salmonicida]